MNNFFTNTRRNVLSILFMMACFFSAQAQLTITPTVTDATDKNSVTGSISLVVTGGTTPYTYSWSNGATTQNLNALHAGAYYVTVADMATTAYATVFVYSANGCGFIVAKNITGATSPSDTSGSIEITNVTSGTIPYTYTWLDDSNNITNLRFNLSPGNYSVAIQDSTGCAQKETYTVDSTMPCVMSVYAYGYPTGNASKQDGSIMLSISDGVTPFTIKVNTNTVIKNDPNTSIDSLGAGLYNLIVTDSVGCKDTISAEVSIDPKKYCNLFNVYQYSIDASAPGVSDGMAYLTIMNSMAKSTVNYMWSNGATTDTIKNLAFGEYNYTVTNSDGCNRSGMVLVKETACTTDYFNYISVQYIDPSNSTANGMIQLPDTVMNDTSTVVSYLWSTGATSNKIENLGPGYYSAIATLSSGCHLFFSHELHMGTDTCTTKAIFSTTTQFFDGDSTLVPLNNMSSNYHKIYWSFGDGSYSEDSVSHHKYTKDGFYDVYLTVWDTITDCSSTTQKSIYVNVLNDTSSIICNAEFNINQIDSLIQIINSSIGSNLTYYFDFGTGISSTKENPKYVYAQNGYYSISLYIYDTLNYCYDNYIKTIAINMKSDTSKICNVTFNKNIIGNQVNLTNNNISLNYSYTWSYGDGTYDYSANGKHTYTLPGYYYVSLNVYDTVTGCQNYFYDEVYIVGDSTTNCNAKFRTIKNNSTVSFINESNGSALKYFWDFGDFSYSNSNSVKNPKYTYNASGLYNVYLSIWDTISGCVSYMNDEIAIGTGNDSLMVLPATADFTFTINQTSKTINLSSKSAGTVSTAYWTYGDGEYGTGNTGQHTYAYPGYFNVCLYIFDSVTGTTAQSCKELRIGSSCDINASFAYFIDPVSKKLTLTDKSTGGVNSWFWNLGDGTTSSNKNDSKTYTTAGFYLVSLAVRDTLNGCADYDAAFIQVGTADCKADFDYNVNAATNTVTLTNKSKGTLANSFWMFDDGSYELNTNPTHTFDAAGRYYVGLTIIDNTGLCVDYTEKYIQIGIIECSANFSTYVDTKDNTAYFSNKSIGASTSLYWTFGDGSYSTDLQPKHKFTNPGYYTVALYTYNSVNACMDYYEENVLISSMANDCEANFVYIVNFKNVKFTDKSEGTGLSYIWNFGDNTANVTAKNPSHDYKKTGIYEVCLLVKNASNIQNITCKTINVSSVTADNCISDFAFIVDSITKKVQFSDLSTGKPNTWKWYFGDGDSASTSDVQHTYATRNFYIAQLTTTNTNTNCQSTTYKLINVGDSNTLKGNFAYVDSVSNHKASGYPVDFVGISHGDAAKLKWSFGDNSAVDSTSLNPRHVYANPGTYTVCLTISDPITGEEDTQCNTVKVGGSSDVTEIQIAQSTLACYPNPADDYTTIDYSLISESAVNITLYSVEGTKLAVMVNTKKQIGSHSLIYNLKELSAGSYYIKMITNTESITKKLIVK